MRPIHAALPLAFLVLAAGCRELPSEQVPVEVEAAQDAATASAPAEGAGPPASTICSAYLNELARVQREPGSGDVSVQDYVAALEGILQDICG
jgi:hypothetical protein